MKATSLVFLICVLLDVFTGSASAESLNFPLELNDENTTIRFEVDSTWHLVEGKTSGVNGKVWLVDPKDLASVRGEIRLPVAKFDTDNWRRDKKMRDVMGAEKDPKVLYSISSGEIKCTPDWLAASHPCGVTIRGELKIHGTSRPWNIPGELTNKKPYNSLHGEAKLRWADFGVEDPSIIVARLNPEVKVIIDVRWNN